MRELGLRLFTAEHAGDLGEPLLGRSGAKADGWRASRPFCRGRPWLVQLGGRRHAQVARRARKEALLVGREKGARRRVASHVVTRSPLVLAVVAKAKKVGEAFAAMVLGEDACFRHIVARDIGVAPFQGVAGESTADGGDHTGVASCVLFVVRALGIVCGDAAEWGALCLLCKGRVRRLVGAVRGFTRRLGDPAGVGG